MAFKVLITGATGYIGGAVLTQFLATRHPGISISALVRSEKQEELLRDLGVTPIRFQGLDDVVVIRAQAALHDVVVSCTSTMDKASCIALVEGLGERRQQGKPAYYIHTSGTSNFGDHPITGSPDTHILRDVDDVFGWEQKDPSAWSVREVDVAVTVTGEQLGVKTFIVNPPIIYGIGNGPGNKLSIQIPTLTKLSLATNQAVVFADGKGLWSVTHISDVARFYDMLLGQIIDGKSVASGKSGYYFLDAGEVSWLQISQAIAHVGKSRGHFESEEPKALNPDEFTALLGKPSLNAYKTEVIWASNSRTRGEEPRARLGTGESVTDLFRSVEEEFDIIASSI